jgi:murein DD-endopeptidase MepM/ murein hydrolase activator NlpD
MSSGFGRRVDPITGRMAWHAGVDFAGTPGSDIVAVASGVVTFAGELHGYGRMIEVNHGGGYSTRYGHDDELLVVAGDVVKKGQVIGRMGSTGRSTGPHVHFEVLKDGHQVDPARYVARDREV